MFIKANPREPMLTKSELYAKLSSTTGAEQKVLIGMLQRRSNK